MNIKEGCFFFTFRRHCADDKAKGYKTVLPSEKERKILYYLCMEVLEGLVPNFSHPIIATLSDRRGRSCTISNVNVGRKGSGSGLYSGGLTLEHSTEV